MRRLPGSAGLAVLILLPVLAGCDPATPPPGAPVESERAEPPAPTQNRADLLKHVTFFDESPRSDVLPNSLLETSRNARDFREPGPVTITENQHAVGANAIFLDVDFLEGESWVRLRITSPGQGGGAFDSRLYRSSGLLHFFLHGEATIEGLSAGLGDGRRDALVPIGKYLTLSAGAGWHEVSIPIAALPFTESGVEAKAVSVFILTYRGPARRVPLLVDAVEVLSTEREACARRVRVNHLGYLPAERKIAKVAGSDLPDLGGQPFRVARVSDGQSVFSGRLEPRAPFEGFVFGESVFEADFTELTTPGRYALIVPGYQPSVAFLIHPALYDYAFYHCARFFYLQRRGQALVEPCAGPWARGATSDGPVPLLSHPKKTIQVRGGIFDGGTSTLHGQFVNLRTLMLLHEMRPDRGSDGQLRIPEGDNGVPDLLDLVRWHVEYLLSLQQEKTGGNYATLTAGRAGTAGRAVTRSSSPADPDGRSREPTYVLDHYRFWDGRGRGTNPLGVTTRDTAAACAVYASASRIFAPYDADFSARCRRAAVRAWAFLRKYPRTLFQEANLPVYVEDQDTDERLWAAAEMWRLTGQQSLHKYFADNYTPWKAPSEGAWRKTWDAAWITYALDPRADPGIRSNIVDIFVRHADRIVRTAKDNGFDLAVASREPWGGLQEAMRNAVLLLWASHLTGRERPYEQVARDQFHYACGRNAQRFSYVSHFGPYSAVNVYCPRMWAPDAPAVPPGYLVWGPRSSDQLMSRYIARRYRDSPHYSRWSEPWFTNQTNLTFLCGYLSSGQVRADWPLRAEALAAELQPASRPASRPGTRQSPPSTRRAQR